MEFLSALFIFAIGWYIFEKLKSGMSSGEIGSTGKKPRPAPKDRSPFLVPDNYVVFDLETTGLNVERNKIIEIGALRISNRTGLATVNAATFDTLIKIKGKVPDKITEITGISTDMLNAEGIPIEDALKEFMHFAQGLPLVAFNAKFDIAFLDVALQKADLPPRTNPSICALELARKAWPGKNSYKLTELTKSITDVGAHRALADCQRALIVFHGASESLKS